MMKVALRIRTTLLMTMTMATMLVIAGPRIAPAQPPIDCLEQDLWCPLDPWQWYRRFPRERNRLEFTDYLTLINSDNSVVYLPPMPQRAPAERWNPFDEKIRQSAAKIQLPKPTEAASPMPAIPNVSLVPGWQPKSPPREAPESPTPELPLPTPTPSN